MQNQALDERAADLEKAYPHDPVIHYARADQLLKQGDNEGAEREARQGLADADAIRQRFDPRYMHRCNCFSAGL